MTRKTKTKKKADVKAKEKGESSQDETASKQILYEEGGNDYGGMPDRDLKKNLGGCG